MRNKIIIILFILIPLYSFSQSWKTINGGINTFSQSGIVFFNDTLNHFLYVGGGFDSIGGILAKRIAKWDGKNWYSLNAPAFNFGITAITMWHNDIYIASNQNNRVRKWDGSTWSVLPAMDNDIKVLKVLHDTLYAGGYFTSAGGKLANGIAKWDGTKWIRVGNTLGILNGCSLCMSVNDIDLYRDTLIIAGYFPLGADSVVGNIAKWDGMKWSSLDQGVKGTISPFDGNIISVFPSGNNLYVGGNFNNVSGISTIGIAKWDGTKWSNIGKGLNGAATSITLFENKITVCGWFDYSGTNYINSLAQWNDSSWVSLDGNQFDRNFVTLSTYNNELYVGGNFNINIEGELLNWIARWSPLDKQTHPTLCNNTCEGVATVTAVGGLSPYTYQWGTSPVQTTPTATGLCAGTYSISVTDVSGSPTTGTVVIASTSDIKITDSLKDVLCNGGNTGEIRLSVTGGIIPYSYNWSSSDTTQNLTHVAAGSYQVTVTDSLRCVVKDSAVVNEPQVLIIEDTVTNATCAVCADGSADVTVSGGTPPYNYEWSNGGSADSIANRLPGMYVVTVTDRNGCVVADTAVIDFNTEAGQLTNEKWIIVPNPVTDKLKITNYKLQIGDKITVTDLLGQTVLFIPYHSSPIPSIDVSHLPPGMYLLKAGTKDGWVITKFIKH